MKAYLHMLLVLAFVSCIDTKKEETSDLPKEIIPEPLTEDNYIEWFMYDEKPLYKRFRDSLSIDSLRLKLEDPNPYHRVNSFYVLMAKKDTSLNSYVRRHLTDTAKIDVTDIDVQWQSYVIDAMINKYLESGIPGPEDRKFLRESIFFEHTHLKAFNYLLKYLKPEKQFYPLVKKYASENREVRSFIALSKYKKQEDIPLLLSAYKNIDDYRDEYFSIIAHFPDRKFQPLLEKHYTDVFLKDKDRSAFSYDNYINALTIFPGEKSLVMLHGMTDSVHYDNKHRLRDFKEEILKALYRKPAPYFLKLRKRLEKELGGEEAALIKQYATVDDDENFWY